MSSKSKAQEPEDLEPRDERHDSVDPATGTLTEEALALRRQRAADEVE